MSWTDERVEILKKLWAKETPAAEIAEVLGTTRNAVIGKAHRLGLSAKKSAAADKKNASGEGKNTSASRSKTKESPPKRKGKTGLLDLTERTCRFPIGHPDKKGFHFCGEPPLPGKPYCAEHCAVAYQAGSARHAR